MMVQGSDLKVGDVFNVNGDRFEVIEIVPSPTNPDCRKVYFVSQTTGRRYLRLIWNHDSLLLHNV